MNDQYGDKMTVEVMPDALVYQHVHRWVAVGIVHVPNPESTLETTLPAVAQSCHCGAVQSVVLPGALR